MVKKLLFICEEIDLALKQRLDQFTLQGIETHALVLPEFTIYRNWEEEVIEVESPPNFLDKIGKFQTNFKEKKILESLESYDSINIYKCSTLCAPLLDNICKISKSYFLTIQNENIEKSRLITKLFDNSFCMIFNTQSDLVEFEKKFGYDEKTFVIKNANHIFSIIDKLFKEKIENFKKYLNLDKDKNLIYCDLGGDIQTQINFINDLERLPKDLLKKSTFLFDLSYSSLVDKEQLIEYLQEKSFDFLMPDSLLSDEYKAMFFTISQMSIVLPTSIPYNTLYPSLYSKSHVYSYGECIKKDDIFVDTFENFASSLTRNTHSNELTNELKEKNREIMTKTYHPDVSLENYMEILKIL